jgi:hypothetical protein
MNINKASLSCARVRVQWCTTVQLYCTCLYAGGSFFYSDNNRFKIETQGAQISE